MVKRLIQAVQVGKHKLAMTMQVMHDCLDSHSCRIGSILTGSELVMCL